MTERNRVSGLERDHQKSKKEREIPRVRQKEQERRRESDAAICVDMRVTLGCFLMSCGSWAPLKSLEQIGPLLAFIGMQVYLLLYRFYYPEPADEKTAKPTCRKFIIYAFKVLALSGTILAVGSSLLFSSSHDARVST
jgi:hypothetical protein